MKTIRITIFFVAALMLVLGTSPLINAQDSFPGNKNLNSGPDPIGIGKNESTVYQFTIDLNANFDNTAIVKDVVPAEFDVDDSKFEVTCGSVITKEPGKSGGKGNPNKLQPDIIIWNLDECDSESGQSLTVTIQTDKNPGHKDIDYFEPTECGPLYLNDGAVMIDGETLEPTEPSNSLFVATCLDGSDTGAEGECVDGDNDGWSVDCGDCDDEDEAINPGAEDICDEIDNNCNGFTDEDCLLPATPG